MKLGISSSSWWLNLWVALGLSLSPWEPVLSFSHEGEDLNESWLLLVSGFSLGFPLRK